MKVLETRATDSATASTLDFLSDYEVKDDSIRSRVNNEIGNYLIDSILKKVAQAKSPLQGEKFDPLSTKYRKFKQADGRGGAANLEFTGRMLENLEYKPKDGNIELGVYGLTAPRADGHNNFSGKSKLPKRRFIPASGDKFKSDIAKRIDEIIRENLTTNKKREVNLSQLASIESKTEFWSILTGLYVGFSRKEIKEAVMRDADMFSVILDLGYDKWL